MFWRWVKKISPVKSANVTISQTGRPSPKAITTEATPPTMLPAET